METNVEKLDIRKDFVTNDGVHIAYHLYDRPKKREEMTPKEYAKALANELYDKNADGKKSTIEKEIAKMECEIRTEKALRLAAESKIRSMFHICRRALEAGKFDKNAYEIMSVLQTEGETTNYIPDGYVSIANQK